MAETTTIAWCHSTFNPWIGCTEVSTAASGGGGCDDCYARALDNRHRWGGATHWGTGVPRMRTSPGYWRQPHAWNRKAAASGQPWRVFCASLADVFDNEVPKEWRRDLLETIAATPNLTWLLLTKRIGLANKMLDEALDVMSHGLTRWADGPWPNVWLGATLVNQMEADRDAPKLLATPAARRFVSYEPALGPVDWSRFKGIDWIIVGGASRQRSRAPIFRAEYARSTIRQARKIGAAPFVKQMGSFVVDRNDAGFDGCDPSAWPLRPDGADPELEYDVHGHEENYQGADCRIKLIDRAGADPVEWPEELRVREVPT